MKSVVEYKEGKPQIKRAETFCSLLGNQIPSKSVFFDALLKEMDQLIRKEHPKVTTGALSNCHGDLYEWLISVQANNYAVVNGSTKLLLQLPNISQFDVISLYSETLFNHIVDLRAKISSSSDVSLISSNPDFVIIDIADMELDIPNLEVIDEITPEVITKLQDTYKLFRGQCSFENISGYLSVKTSLRPDRRLQISHEGSLMKALYVHLQNREWIINPVGIKYFAAATSISEADRKGLKTVATHSITNVQSIPEAAVDEVYLLNTVDDSIAVFNEILA
ncbi:MAG: Cfr10I/Bse634I family restriction endonuclease [Methylococcales bacterium]|nr:Cfr10I/Bse634I family restriction endonuclease [Methylococcales bacterium]